MDIALAKSFRYVIVTAIMVAVYTVLSAELRPITWGRQQSTNPEQFVQGVDVVGANERLASHQNPANQDTRQVRTQKNVDRAEHDDSSEDPDRRSVISPTRPQSDTGIPQGMSTTLVSTTPTLRYIPPPAANVTTIGRPFDVSAAHWERLIPTSFFNLTRESARDFVFVTAADFTHFEETKDSVASIQTKFPGYRIMFYDIGLKHSQKQQVESWCNVEMIFLDLSQYPKWTRDRRSKCWKYIIIQDALSRDGAVFWVDSSFRAVDHVRQWTDTFDQAVDNGGIILTSVDDTPYLNHDWINPAMYEYIPTDEHRQRTVHHECSCSVLIYNTAQMFHNVLWWMYMCSLEANCCSNVISVEWKTARNETKMLTTKHDQASLNLLLSNYHGYDNHRYVSQISHQTIRRRPTSMYELTLCKSG